MRSIAVALACLLLVTSAAVSASAWCWGEACDETPVARDCCHDSIALATADAESERPIGYCRLCVASEDGTATIPDRPFDPAPAAVCAERRSDTPIVSDLAAVAGLRPWPTGPPLTSAVLRDLRGIRLLI